MGAPLEGAPIPGVRCSGCRALFVDRRGPCPRCGKSDWSSESIPSHGVVLAATELAVPPVGYSAPHRLLLIELPGGARLLASSPAPPPSPGSSVAVRRDGERWTVASG